MTNDLAKRLAAMPTPMTDRGPRTYIPRAGSPDDGSDDLEYVSSDFARRLERENALLREALIPFADDAYQDALGGQVQGDDSPMFGRNDHVLLLGDFRRARAVLALLEGK